MGLKFNNTDIYAVNFNLTSLTQINFNNVPVWYALTACTVSGTTQVGYTLSAKTTPSEVQSLCSYQWYRGNVLINGATKSTYTLTSSDRGYQMKCIAKIGSASVTSNVTGVVKQSVTSISISGVNEEGYTLSSSVSPSGVTGTYQWQRDGSNISGANGSSYTLTHSDAGHYIRCVFTANGNWTGTVYSSQTDKVWGWYDWSNSAEGSWSGYPSSPRYATLTIPSNTKVTHLHAHGGKSYVEGEYGKCHVQAYYNNTWNTLASSDYGFSGSDCYWSGECWPSQVRVEYGFQVCQSVSCKIEASGKQKRQG